MGASQGYSPIVDLKTCSQAAKSLGLPVEKISIEEDMGCRIANDQTVKNICSVGEFGCQCTRECANGGVGCRQLYLSVPWQRAPRLEGSRMSGSVRIVSTWSRVHESGCSKEMLGEQQVRDLAEQSQMWSK